MFKVEGILNLLSRNMYYSGEIQEMDDHPISRPSLQAPGLVL